MSEDVDLWVRKLRRLIDDGEQTGYVMLSLGLASELLRLLEQKQEKQK